MPGPPIDPAAELAVINTEITACRACPRLVGWREESAAHPPRRFTGQSYWQRPVPGFGDPRASVLLVGLAPAAHGGNRTGRMFTGDRSGDFLFAALHRAGFASQATSTAAGDGLVLQGLYVAAINRCAPPLNRPTTRERDACLPYLGRELTALVGVRTVIALGAYAWNGVLLAARREGRALPRPKPRFGHGAEADIGPWRLIGSFHPSQQNTFTGRLTDAMLDAVLVRTRASAGLPPAGPDRTG